MIVKDKGNRKRKKLGRKVEELKWKKRCVAFEDAAKRLLKNLEDSEYLKVSLSELKEHLDTPEAARISVMQIAEQAKNERGQMLFTRSSGWHGGEQEGHAERKKHPRSIKRRYSKEFKEFTGAKGKRSFGARTKEACVSSGKAKGKRAIIHRDDARDIMSVESCSSSMACDMEEAGFGVLR